MHDKMKSYVRSKFGVTEFFKLKEGVRQYYLLSPLLFALFFITCLIICLILEYLWDIHMFSPLYADDLILIAFQ